MRLLWLFALLFIVACTSQTPPEPAAIIAAQTVQDQHNRVPLLEGKATLFVDPATSAPAVVWQAGQQLPNPVPAALATGRVEAVALSGEAHSFTFQVVPPLRAQLLPVAIGDKPAPTVTPSDLTQLERAVVQLLPFNAVHFTTLPEQALPASAVTNLWPAVLTLAQRHGTPGSITIAVIPGIPGQESSGSALTGQGAAALMLRHHDSSSLALSTFVHEVAHALGAHHAPCGSAANPDPRFPTSDGRVPETDVMFDQQTKQRITGVRFDLMGYCSPKWVSSFTTLKTLGR